MTARKVESVEEIGPMGGWRFLAGRGGRRWLCGDGDAGDPVELPHSWNATDSYRPGIDYRQGFGCYRAEVDLEPEGRVWRLETGGFYGLAEVFVNGGSLGRHPGDYLGLCLDLGDRLAVGRNVLALRLDNRYHRDVLPGRRDPDFVLYGGLAGGAALRSWPLLHLDPERTAVDVAVTPEAGAPSTVRVTVEARNHDREPRRAHLRAALRAATGERVVAIAGELSTIPAGGTLPLVLELRAEGVSRWSPERPALYLLELELRGADDAMIDRQQRRIGFRHAHFGEQGLELDGRRQPLHGANRHESVPGFGNALPVELHRRDAEQLRELGANFVRLSHYPQSPIFLDACDELGLFVYAELASWKSVRPGRWLRAARRQWRRLIERDRHRPSVLVWGMGNESRSRRAYLDLAADARRLDPERPVSYAENHLYRARRQGTVGLVDVWGVNYELDVLEEARRAAKGECVLVTECMNACLREEPAGLEQRQLVAMTEEWPAIAERPWVAGHLVWCFADYATPYRRRYRRTPGLVDAWRAPRAGAWLFAARHGDRPVLHLDADWRRDGPAERRVRVISDRFPVTVGVGDEPLARLDAATGWQECRIPWRDGTLWARAGEGGEEHRAELESWGEPERLEVEAGAVLVSRVEEGGWRVGDWLRLEVRALDARGARCRDHEGTARVETDADARLVTLDGEGTVELHGGVGVAWLRPRREGELTLRARPMAPRSPIDGGETTLSIGARREESDDDPR